MVVDWRKGKQKEEVTVANWAPKDLPIRESRPLTEGKARLLTTMGKWKHKRGEKERGRFKLLTFGRQGEIHA